GIVEGRPSAGRASVGPAMVIGVPPARITPAYRFPMSPPMTSKTRSTPPDGFEDVVVEVDELLRAEVSRLLTVGGASGADHLRPALTCELRHHRPDCADRTVHETLCPA